MRCSHCRALLPACLDRSLAHRARYHVVHHLRACAQCRAWLEEVRVIDGLLATSPCADPAPNFTHVIMSEVRTMPVPAVHRTNPWWLLCAYVAVAWIIIGAWLKLTGVGWATAVAFGTNAGAHLSVGLQTLAEAAQHAFGTTTPTVAAAVAGVLLLDILVGAAFFAFYTVLRPRLAAELAYVRKV